METSDNPALRPLHFNTFHALFGILVVFCFGGGAEAILRAVHSWSAPLTTRDLFHCINDSAFAFCLHMVGSIAGAYLQDILKNIIENGPPNAASRRVLCLVVLGVYYWMLSQGRRNSAEMDSGRKK
jgi:hypothetical protein